MKRAQFSIITLLGAVTLAGLGCAALVNASPVLAAVVTTGTLLLFLAATVGAVYARSRARTFCGGLVIVGGPYLLLTMTTGLFDRFDQYLLTNAAHDVLYAALEIKHETPANTMYPGTPAIVFTAPVAPAGGPLPAPQPVPVTTFAPVPTGAYYRPAPYTGTFAGAIDYQAFDRIGHSLWAIILGICGGTLASWLAGGANAKAPRESASHIASDEAG